jgi:hypothetical protein
MAFRTSFPSLVLIASTNLEGTTFGLCTETLTTRRNVPLSMRLSNSARFASSKSASRSAPAAIISVKRVGQGDGTEQMEFAGFCDYWVSAGFNCATLNALGPKCSPR